MINKVLSGEIPWYVETGDCREVMRGMPPDSVHLICTSPPYYGAVRDYQIPPSIWGGSEGCAHQWREWQYSLQSHGDDGSGGNLQGSRKAQQETRKHFVAMEECVACGAQKMCLGNEPTAGLYVDHLASIFDEALRILRPDGVMFVVIGDSYPVGNRNNNGPDPKRPYCPQLIRIPDKSCVPKSLLLIPTRLAEEMKNRGWILRSEIIWKKGNAYPESVRDRPGVCHEKILMFVKNNKKIFWTHNEKPGTRRKPLSERVWEDRLGIEPNRVDVPDGEKDRWKRKSLWEGHDYYYDYVVIQEPIIYHNVEKAIGGKKHSGVSGSRYSGNLISARGYATKPHAPRGDGSQEQNHGIPSSVYEARGSRTFWCEGEGEIAMSVMADALRDIGVSEEDIDTAVSNVRGQRSIPGDVWDISTSGTKLEHYAAYPVALVSKMVAVGSSDGGVCAKCGAPRWRIVKRERLPDRPGRVQGRGGDSIEVAHGLDGRSGNRHTTSSINVRWTPTCECGCEEMLGAVVLDMFSGVASTGVAARRGGRRYVGIELSQRYVEIGNGRIMEDFPLANVVDIADDNESGEGEGDSEEGEQLLLPGV